MYPPFPLRVRQNDFPLRGKGGGDPLNGKNLLVSFGRVPLRFIKTTHIQSMATSTQDIFKPQIFLSLLHKTLICHNLQFHKKETKIRTELYLNNLYSSFRWVGVFTENHTCNDAFTFCQQNPNTITDKQECNNDYAKDPYLSSRYLNNMHLDNLCSQFDPQLV